MLNQNEALALEALKNLKGRHAWAQGIQESLQGADDDQVRVLIGQLLQQWKDNPGLMEQLLGFDLPKLMDVKLYGITEVNYHLATTGKCFCARKEIHVTRFDGEYNAQMDVFKFKGWDAIVYVDDWLHRYLRLGNGQLFECSNADLEGLTGIAQINLRAYLTGLID